MARQKNPTALFDVIHSAKKPPKASPSASIPTPKWWGKGKKLPTTPVVVSTENVGKQKSWLTRAKENGVVPGTASIASSAAAEPVKDTVAPVEPAAVSNEPTVGTAIPAVEMTPKPRFIDRFVNRAPKAEPVVESTAATEDFSERFDDASTDDSAYPQTDEPISTELKPDVRQSRTIAEPVIRIDSAGGDIKFRLSYAAVIAVGFIFMVSLAIAFVAGRQSASAQLTFDDDFAGGSKATPTTLPTSYGSMMAVGPVAPEGPADKAAASDPKPADNQPSDVRPDVLKVSPHPAKPPAAVLPDNAVHNLLPTNSKTRTIGLIYVIVQSYAEKDLAERACDFMNAQGVDCTVVQGPSHWALPDWYSVVSLQPFNKHDPELPDYEKAVRAIGTKFTSRALDQFQPQGYTWRADSDMSQQ